MVLAKLVPEFWLLGGCNPDRPTLLAQKRCRMRAATPHKVDTTPQRAHNLPAHGWCPCDHGTQGRVAITWHSACIEEHRRVGGWACVAGPSPGPKHSPASPPPAPRCALGVNPLHAPTLLAETARNYHLPWVHPFLQNQAPQSGGCSSTGGAVPISGLRPGGPSWAGYGRICGGA